MQKRQEKFNKMREEKLENIKQLEEVLDAEYDTENEKEIFASYSKRLQEALTKTCGSIKMEEEQISVPVIELPLGLNKLTEALHILRIDILEYRQQPSSAATKRLQRLCRKKDPKSALETLQSCFGLAMEERGFLIHSDRQDEITMIRELPLKENWTMTKLFWRTIQDLLFPSNIQNPRNRFYKETNENFWYTKALLGEKCMRKADTLHGKVMLLVAIGLAAGLTTGEAEDLARCALIRIVLP